MSTNANPDNFSSHNNNSISSEHTNNTIFAFSSNDIKTMTLGENGSLLISLKDGNTVIVDNFKEMAHAGQQFSLADGSMMDTQILAANLALTTAGIIYIGQPSAGSTLVYNLQAGEKYELAFNTMQPGEQVREVNGALIVTFADNGTIVLKNFHDALAMQDSPSIIFGGKDLNLKDFVQLASAHDQFAQTAQQLANMEPAAGSNNAAGSASNHGYGFQSELHIDPVVRLSVVGTIGETSLQYNTPTFETVDQLGRATQGDISNTLQMVTPNPLAEPPTITVNGGNNNIQVKEDGSITISLTAQHGVGAAANEVLTITITGINPASGFSSPVPGGVYNPMTGTFTVTLAPGENLNTTITFTPPHNSDVDLNNLTATVTTTEPTTATTASASASASDIFQITTDAVADAPILTVAPASEEAGHAIALSISTMLTDTDGSETIRDIQISGLPIGAMLNAGTDVNGIWTLMPAQLAGLTITVPKGVAAGDYNLTVVSTSMEHPTDREYDLTDNTASTTQTLTLHVTTNDVPVITGPDAQTVDESGLTNGPLTASGTATAAFGTDGPGTFTGNGTFTVSTTLTTHGEPVTVTQTGNGYTGTNADGHMVFTLTLNPTTGQYTYTQDLPLDHPNINDPHDVITLNFGFNANDADGDFTPGTINIDVQDDGPIAIADTTTLNHVASVIGNILTNDNGSGDGDKSLVSVTFNGTTYLIPANGINIAGTYGTLNINQTGAYIYTARVGATGVDNFNYTMQDGDGDTSSTTFKVTVNDGSPPVVTNPPACTCDETDLSNGPVILSGQITASLGNDSPGTFAGITSGFSATGSIAGGTLTSEDRLITVTLSDNTYTGMAGGEAIFMLTLNPTTGDYTFKLLGTLDHADGNNPNDIISLSFGFAATGSDGESTPGAITINVKDDASIAHDDHNNFYCDPTHVTATGNVITGLNGGADAADKMSQDGITHITSISFNGHSVAVPATGTAAIDGANGTLQIAADGSYTYTLHNAPVTEPCHFDETLGFLGSLLSGLGTNGLNLDADANALLGVKVGDLNIAAGADVNVKLIADSTHAVNGLGYFGIAADGTIQLVSLLGANGHAPGASDNYSFVAPADGQLGFFLAAGLEATSGLDLTRGALEFIYKDGTAEARPANIHDNGALISLVYVDATTHAETLINGPLYFTTERGEFSQLNLDGSVQVLSGLANVADNSLLRIGFEGDVNLIFDVGYTKTPANIGDSFTYTEQDGDGDTSSANLVINSTHNLPAAHIDISLNAGADLQLTEGAAVFVGVKADLTNSKGNESTVLTLHGAAAAWGLVGDGWHATGNAGEYQLTLLPGANHYDGGFTLNPAYNLGADLLAGLSLTASVSDPDTPSAAITATAHVHVAADVGLNGIFDLTGGVGADLFVLPSQENHGAGQIHNFNCAEGDKIDLSQVLQNFNPTQDAINNFVFTRTDGANTILSVDKTGHHDTTHAVDVAVLANVAVTVEALTQAHAIVTAAVFA